MCREKFSPRCCIDHMLVILIILSLMLFYMYVTTENEGIISILVILCVFSFIICTIRLEDYGCPNWITNCKKICNEEIDDEDRPH